MLVDTLCQLFAQYDIEEFLMSWNRRIAQSSEFFDQMKAAGFTCVSHGKGIYSFTLPERVNSSNA
jgi:hypothetical protein